MYINLNIGLNNKISHVWIQTCLNLSVYLFIFRLILIIFHKRHSFFMEYLIEKDTNFKDCSVIISRYYYI